MHRLVQLHQFYDARIKKRETYFFLDFLQKSQFNSLECNYELQWKALNKLLKHARTNCPYYQEMFSGLHIYPDSLTYEDFLRLPFLTKDIIRKRHRDMISRNLVHEIWAKTTGGSTGEPLKFYYHEKSYEWRMAISMRGYGWAGCLPGTRQVYLWGVNLEDGSLFRKVKDWLYNYVNNRLILNCFRMDEPTMYNMWKRIIKFKPKVIVGYTNPLFEFSRFISNNNLTLNLNLRSIITAAEGLHEFQRKLIESVWQAPVFNTYGSREFMLIASECEKHEGLHVNIENLFVEIINAEGEPAQPGEVGEIVITDLNNYAMPFIRYKIGDLGVWKDNACSCGRGLPLLLEITGRKLDVIRTSNGKFVPGEFFPHFFKDFSQIRKFQVIQRKLNEIEIKICPIGRIDSEVLSQIEHKLKEYLGNDMQIVFNLVGHIDLTPSGKFRVTISEVADA